MKRNHQYKHLLLICMAAALLAGCKKFLTVQPDDKYTEEQVYSSEPAIRQALNGLYNRFAGNSLYGANLGMRTLDLMGQQYNVVYSGSNNYQAIQQYNYQSASVQDLFDALWSEAYATILAVNKFIVSVDKAAGNKALAEDKARQMKGEATGLRAMLQLDLLRLFGPIYATGAGQPAIPYATRPEGKTLPILTASEAMDSVLADLQLAETLLADDPVISKGVVQGEDFYGSFRNQRMNYYAVKGLQARAFLYKGDRPAAWQAAKDALDEGEKWFPWLGRDPIMVQKSDPDRIFSTELLLGIYNPAMYNNFRDLFSADLLDQNILSAQPARLTNIFENNENDYRYISTWLNSAKGYRTFSKYADIATPGKPWRFVTPLLRKTELYYILAETETDPGLALGYLNKVRFNRGLVDLPGTAVLATEIQKEYQREFWGEGQLFFFYKRLNKTSIPSGISGTANITMNAAKYVVPLPYSETTPR